MLSRAVHRTLTPLILMLVAAGSWAADDERAYQPQIDDAAQRRIVETIQDIRARSGANSPDLIEPLTALARYYQDGGDYGPASEAIERARGLVRSNFGVHSLDQTTLLQLSVRNEELRGNFEDAWEIERELLALIGRHPDDLRIVPVLHEIGAKRMALLARYSAGEFPPQLFLGCYYRTAPADSEMEAGSCTAGSRRVAIWNMLSDGLRKYERAVRVLFNHGQFSSDELMQIETEMIRSSYEYGSYQAGARSLRRILSYHVANSEPLATRVEALMQMADWDQLFEVNVYAPTGSAYGTALETYQQAYQLLRDDPSTAALAERLFSPEMAVVVPMFAPNPLVSEQTPASTGYIDIAFVVTKHGVAKRVKILDTTTNASFADKRELVRRVQTSRFRPRVVDGAFADAAPVTLRYYVSEQSPRDAGSRDLASRDSAPRVTTGTLSLPQ
jgi:tetratricopeptide (TPR) repeat protein